MIEITVNNPKISAIQYEDSTSAAAIASVIGFAPFGLNWYVEKNNILYLSFYYNEPRQEYSIGMSQGDWLVYNYGPISPIGLNLSYNQMIGFYNNLDFEKYFTVEEE